MYCQMDQLNLGLSVPVMEHGHQILMTITVFKVSIIRAMYTYDIQLFF